MVRAAFFAAIFRRVKPASRARVLLFASPVVVVLLVLGWVLWSSSPTASNDDIQFETISLGMDISQSQLDWRQMAFDDNAVSCSCPLRQSDRFLIGTVWGAVPRPR